MSSSTRKSTQLQKSKASSNSLQVLGDVERRLAAIEHVDEAKGIADQAEAIRVYAKKAKKGLHVQNRAAGIKILAERRGGELLSKLPRQQGNKAEKGKTVIRATLAEIKLAPRTADRWQVLATIPAEKIRTLEAECNAKGAEFTSASLYTSTSRKTREQKTAAALRTQVQVTAPGLHHGDFRTLAPSVLPDASAQLVLTDPPYDADSVALFGDAAKEAARVLRPGGSLLIYSGQKYLGDVIVQASAHLRYWWTFALVHGGNAQLLQKLGVRCGWKPILWFVKGTRGDVSAIVSDVVDGAGREKDAHEWQQGEAEAAALIESFTQPDDLVVDFCAGSGTVLVAAKRLGRRFAGFEQRADHVQTIERRIA